MTKTYSIPLAVVLGVALTLLVGVQAAFAQENAPRGERPTPLRILQERAADVRADLRADAEARGEARDEFREDLKEKRDEFRDRQIDLRADVRTDVATTRVELRAQADVERAEIKARLDAATTEEEREAILEEARAQREAMRTAALETRDEFRARISDVRDQVRENRAEFRAEVKTEVGVRAKVHLENILKRVGNAIEKFTDILARVHNKIAELEANGIDATTAVQAAATAEVSIGSAADALAKARTAFSLMLESDTPRDHIEGVKAATRAATEEVKQAHADLKAAVSELKALIRSINVEVDASVEAEANATVE